MDKYREMMIYQLDLAGILLVILLLLMIVILWRAQRAEGFDLKEALKNDEGKVSFLRICSLGAFAFSSWALMKQTLAAGGIDPLLYGEYVALWGGMPMANKFIDALQVKWSK